MREIGGLSLKGGRGLEEVQEFHGRCCENGVLM